MLLNNFLSSFHGICLKVFAIVILSPSFSHFTSQCYPKKKLFAARREVCKKLNNFPCHHHYFDTIPCRHGYNPKCLLLFVFYSIFALSRERESREFHSVLLLDAHKKKLCNDAILRPSHVIYMNNQKMPIIFTLHVSISRYFNIRISNILLGSFIYLFKQYFGGVDDNDSIEVALFKNKNKIKGKMENGTLLALSVRVINSIKISMGAKALGM